jgi:hypothetical protein
MMRDFKSELHDLYQQPLDAAKIYLTGSIPEICCDFDSRNSVVCAVCAIPSTSIIEVQYLAPYSRHIPSNSIGRIGRLVSVKVVNNELTLKILKNRNRTFIYYFIFAFLEMHSFK